MIHRTKLDNLPIVTPLLKFAFLYFFIKFGDGIMSYIIPIHIDNQVQNTFLMGIIISASSFFGIFFDFWIDKYLWDKTYKFFVKATLIAALGFPLTMIFFPKHILAILFAMILWSAYYEFVGYSSYNFIHKFLHKDMHTFAWAMLNAFGAVAYLVAPFLAGYLIDKGDLVPFYGALVAFFVAIIMYKLMLPVKREQHKPINNVEQSHRNVKKEFEILGILLKRVWPLAIYGIALEMIDAFFWTIGPLFSEELRTQSYIGGFLLSAYSFPVIFASLITNRANISHGKKRISFITAFAAGALLTMIAIVKNVWVLVGGVLLMSTIYSISMILFYAVIEDYIARLNKFGNDMITLNQMSTNVGYVIGPVFAGFIASKIGNQLSFLIVGLFLMLVSILCIALVPKKVLMPKTELEHIVAE